MSALSDLVKMSNNKAVQDELAAMQTLKAACVDFIEYRDRNTLNFQLEKADDFIFIMRNALRSGVQEEGKQ